MSRLSEALVERFLETHPGDAALLLADLPAGEAGRILSSVSPATAAGTLVEMSPTNGGGCLKDMDHRAAARILSALPTGVVVSLLAPLGPETRELLMADLSDDFAGAVRQRLEFAPGTVGRLMEAPANVVRTGFSAEEARGAIARPTMPYLYVVDSSQKLVGVLSVRDIDPAREGALENRVVRNPVSLPASMPLDAARSHPAWQEFDLLPVVDRDFCLAGTLRHKQVRQRAEEGHARVDGASGIDALVSLGEAYCSGLWEIIGPITQPGEPALERSDPTGEDAR